MGVVIESECLVTTPTNFIRLFLPFPIYGRRKQSTNCVCHVGKPAVKTASLRTTIANTFAGETSIKPFRVALVVERVRAFVVEDTAVGIDTVHGAPGLKRGGGSCGAGRKYNISLAFDVCQSSQDCLSLIPQKIVFILHIIDVAFEDTAVGVNPFGDLIETACRIR